MRTLFIGNGLERISGGGRLPCSSRFDSTVSVLKNVGSSGTKHWPENVDSRKTPHWSEGFQLLRDPCEDEIERTVP